MQNRRSLLAHVLAGLLAGFALDTVPYLGTRALGADQPTTLEEERNRIRIERASSNCCR